ncbi:MAG: copper-binding protein [Hyphomicrobiaceae bacterium]|nr:copper-binding protein [Hyphomicrobiaceae bacterium]
MLKILMATATLAVGACLFVTGVDAAEMDHGKMDHGTMDHGKPDHSQMDHSKMDHGNMNHEAKPGATEAQGVGVINTIDGAKKQVNLTHEPMPELGWPSMTMDLPVTGKVDLDGVKAGDKVTFRLKLGRDKVYRIMEMSQSKAP